MVIVYIMGGIGNQLYQYAAGRRLAHKLNTELKLDTTFYDNDNLRPYALNLFNIKESIATHEEIECIKKISTPKKIGIEGDPEQFMPEVLRYPNDVWLHGYWGHEKYFADISNILRKEFTLKQTLSSNAKSWKEKILASECSVSLHFRHGDFAYSPINSAYSNFSILPLDYYYECIQSLQNDYKNLTLFVFSDNLNWVKENLHVDLPTEFVEGEDLKDVEELYLMSLCKHNITANSTFSWWGAWLNQNPSKKVFRPIPSVDSAKVESQPSPKKKNTFLDSDKWIKVPFIPKRELDITQKPYFSLLLVVDNNVATLEETLYSIFGQDYKFYELIIIDNASTDGSGKICRQTAKNYDNVTLIKLHNKVTVGVAWNMALDIAQGDFIIFLKGNDLLVFNALSSMYLVNEHPRVDVVNSVCWLREDENGTLGTDNRKFNLETDEAFKDFQGIIRGKFDKLTILKILSASNSFYPPPITTKIFNRKFLVDNGILFNEKTKEDAEILFKVNAMLQANENIFVKNPYYIAPRK